MHRETRAGANHSASPHPAMHSHGLPSSPCHHITPYHHHHHTTLLVSHGNHRMALAGLARPSGLPASAWYSPRRSGTAPIPVSTRNEQEDTPFALLRVLPVGFCIFHRFGACCWLGCRRRRRSVTLVTRLSVMCPCVPVPVSTSCCGRLLVGPRLRTPCGTTGFWSGASRQRRGRRGEHTPLQNPSGCTKLGCQPLTCGVWLGSLLHPPWLAPPPVFWRLSRGYFFYTVPR
jgi:hypothetical protein